MARDSPVSGRGALLCPGKGETTLALSLTEFNRMVADYGPALYRMAYRMVGDRHEAEDLVQEAFRSAWKSRASFQPDGGSRAWIMSILRRRAADHWRKSKPPTVVSGNQNLEVGVPADDPLRDEFTDEMQQALGQLPQDLRESLAPGRRRRIDPSRGRRPAASPPGHRALAGQPGSKTIAGMPPGRHRNQ